MEGPAFGQCGSRQLTCKTEQARPQERPFGEAGPDPELKWPAEEGEGGERECSLERTLCRKS